MSTLKAINVCKDFPGVQALDRVSIEIKSGVVNALVGANGAGKSTLIKILTGYYPDYQGDIEIDGQKVAITKPSDAIAQGIEVVHQEVDTSVIPYLSVAENLLIEALADPHRAGFINWSKFYQEARGITSNVGWSVDVRQRVENLVLHEKQLLVIARAVSRNVKFLILDEPSASLSLKEVEVLFRVIKGLKKKGVGILYISHRLSELGEIADSITVLRHGKLAGNFVVSTDMSPVIEAMLGKQATAVYPERSQQPPGEIIYEVQHVSRKGYLDDISFNIRAGEVLGLTGLVGAGKTELVRALFGADKIDRGEILIKGQSARIRIPEDAVKLGIFLVPEERRKHGLWVDDNLRQNITAPFLQLYSILGWMSRRKELAQTYKVIDLVGLTPALPEMPVKNFSGGNQQKIVIGKWTGQEPFLLFMDEPTQGIDIKAKQDVYDLAISIGKKAAVIFVSSDIDEVLAVTNRVLIMRDGRIVANLPSASTTRQAVLEYATSIRTDSDVKEKNQ